MVNRSEVFDMRSLVYLQEGVLAENKDIVSSYIDDLDLRTANEEMIKAGEKFGFKTIKIYEKVYGVMSEIAGILGYIDPSSYGKLLRKWEIYTPSLGGIRQRMPNAYSRKTWYE